jgi:alkanesulfonate monooxygenase SsuD/methylene tetrahydromethanopterin reductase-like flavin-dependent oxidoreductase (luciferase family)
MRIDVPAGDLPSARAAIDHGFICGAPGRVGEAIAELADLGVGGVIATFRLGPMPHAAAAASLRLFMTEVAPRFASVRRDLPI